LTELVSPEIVRVGAVLLLTSPFTPMLWMGEEWATAKRWPFFTSHPEPELAEATGKGRLEEFANYGWDTSQMIDPQDPAAYHEAILDWSELSQPGHAEVLELYRELIALRAAEPDLHSGALPSVAVDYDERSKWVVVHRGAFRVAANLDDAEHRVPVTSTEIVLATGPAAIEGDALVLGPQTAAIVRAG
jgi:maltooligosyltrehalose trehalohydrolase